MQQLRQVLRQVQPVDTEPQMLKVLKNKLVIFLSPNTFPPPKKKVKKMFIKSSGSSLFFTNSMRKSPKKSLRFKPPQRPSSLRAPWDPPWDPWPSVKFCWSSRYVQPRSDLGKVRQAGSDFTWISLKRQYQKKKEISKEDESLSSLRCFKKRKMNLSKALYLIGLAARHLWKKMDS